MMYDINGNRLSMPESKKQVSDVLLCNNLISHRGLNTAPENTIPALEEAITAGYKHLEIDLGWTTDGVCVLLHDNTIDRTSDGSGSIASMTFAIASQYDFGSWKNEKYAGTKIPTLKEALLLAKANNVAIQLDIADKSKNPTDNNLQTMLDDISTCGMMSYVNICCYPDRAQKIISMCPDVNITIGLDIYTIEQAAEMVKDCNFVCLSRQYSNYNDSLAVEAHERGWKMQTWTINDVATAKAKFLTGADWIITDSVLPSDLCDPYTLTEADKETIVNEVLANFINVSEVGM